MTASSTAFDVATLVGWTGGEWVSGDRHASFEGASIDSRAVGTRELFVAIRGPNHDAHGFLASAVETGAAGVLVERGADWSALDGTEVPIVAVADTTTALGDLAAGHRSRFDGPLVGITGSSGKTTTKEMCSTILATTGPCLRNRGNLNNEFGLPLTLLARRPPHRTAVVELGMNHRGEIARLAAISRPTVGLITNVGTAHIEFLGSREEIAREKGDLFGALDSDACAVVNRDDEYIVAQAGRIRGRSVSYAQATPADFTAHSVRFDEDGVFSFQLDTPDGACAVRVRGLGETTIINALAASAAAWAAGASLDDIVAGLEGFRGVGGRMARISLENGATLVDDTYNANPQSMRAALESVSRLKGRGRALAVVGDMGELGDAADAAHREVGRWAAELGIDLLFAQGERAGLVARGATQAGMASSAIHVSAAHRDTADSVRAVLRADDWVLVKGSRAMKMERVIEALSTEGTV